MSSSQTRGCLALAVTLLPIGLLVACSSAPPEQQLLSQFFRAARNRDNETMARMAAVDFDSREQGEVTRFEITSVSEERRTALNYRAMIDAQAKATTDLEEFRKRRYDFESTNRPALEIISKLEKDPAAKFDPKQQALKAEWDKRKQDALGLQKTASNAKTQMADSIGPAEASLSQPGQPAFSAEKFTGELISKDVTINADVRKDGQTSQKTMVVTIQRVEGAMDGNRRTGRSIITRIQGA